MKPFNSGISAVNLTIIYVLRVSLLICFLLMVYLWFLIFERFLLMTSLEVTVVACGLVGIAISMMFFKFYLDRMGEPLLSNLIPKGFKAYIIPIAVLASFRWLLTRDKREEIDLIINDLKDDKSDMVRQKRSKWFIFFVLSWHATRVISIYIWDGMTSIAKCVVPITKFLSK